MTNQVLNQSPYFDDFDIGKNFTSVLFKPGFPVQARELNQLQTILAYNSKNTSDKLFRSGECVNNKTPKHLVVDYITIDSISPFDNAVVDINKITKSLLGTASNIIENNINAKVIKIVDAIDDDPITIYVSYRKNLVDTNTDTNIDTYIAGETINCYDDNGNLSYSVKVRCPTCPGGTRPDLPPVGFGTLWSIPDSIYYVNNSFITIGKSIVVAEKYSIDEIDYKFGFDINHRIISVEDDFTLYDNSLDYPNYTGPGADREAIYLTPTFKTIDFKETESFILIAEVKDGVITMIDDSKGIRTFEANAKNKREYDGNYILNHGRLNFLPGTTDDKFKVAISPTIVTVDGYEVITKDTVIEVDKARTTEKIDGFVSRTRELNYIVVDLIDGSLTIPGQIEHGSVFSNVAVKLYLYLQPTPNIDTAPPTIVPALSGTGFDGQTNEFGSIMIYDIKREDNIHTNRYRIYFTKLTINSGYKFQHTKGLYLDFAGNGVYFAKTVNDINSGKPTIYNGEDPVLLFNVGKRAVKSIRSNTNSTHPSLVYTNRKKYSGVLNSSAAYSWNITNTQDFSQNDITKIIGGVISVTGTGFCDAFIPDRNNIVVSLDGTTTTIYSANFVPSTTTPRYFITIVDNNTITFTSNQVGDVGKKVFILVDVLLSDVTEKTKTLVNTTQEIVFYTGTGLGTAINQNNFPHADIYRIIDIKNAANESVRENFGWFNGQTDTEYKLGTLWKLNNAYRIQSTNDMTLERVWVEYEYFDHSNFGDYFSVNSYESFVADHDYNLIPKYSSKNNQVYYLADCIDFRPLNLGSTVTTIIQPSLNKQFVCDVEYYLPRKDTISVNVNGDIIYHKGTPKAYASQPPVRAGETGIYFIRIAPYGFDFNRDFTVNVLEHRLFKMEDIGRIQNKFEKFKEKIEYSLLEQEAISMSIRDKTSGAEKFKNGMIIDNFTTFNSCNLAQPDFKCSLSRELGELHPSYTLFDTNFYFDENGSTHFKRFGDIIMIDFDEQSFIKQPNASRSIPINEHDITPYKGNIILVPNVDNFGDVEEKPTHIIEPEAKINQTQNVFNDNGLVGLEDGLWSNYNRLIVKDNEFLRPGAELEHYSFPDRISFYSNLDNKDIAVVPYARSTVVQFFANGLKPNTRLYCFFDGTSVTANCRPLTTSSIYGEAIKTDSKGNVAGEFLIPAKKFFCGRRIFRLTSDSTNNPANDLKHTSTETVFFCGGYEEDNNLKNTDNCLTPIFKPKEGINKSTNLFDPIAQTFKTDRDCWLTSVDLFFNYVDPSDDIHIEITTTETDNNIPSSFSFGQSGVIKGANIQYDELSTTATNFKLIYPVFLRSDTTYAVVIYNKISDTRIWNSHLGEEDIEIFGKTISKQIDTGSFFRKRGNRWTEYLNEDLKINLYRAKFKYSNMTVVMRNLPLNQFYNSARKIIQTELNQNKIRVLAPNHAMSVNDKSKFDCFDDYWIQLNNSNQRLAYGQKIISETGSGTIKSIRSLSGNWQYKLTNTSGYFLSGQTFTLENFTPSLSENDLVKSFLQSDIVFESTKDYIGTIATVVNDTLSGISMNSLNGEYNVSQIDSADTYIITVPELATENQFYANNEINLNGRFAKRYDKFNLTGSFVGNNCSWNWKFFGTTHSVNNLFVADNYLIRDLDIQLGRDIRLHKPCKIVSTRNEQLYLPSESSVKVVGTFTASDVYNSPMINIKTFNMVCISNNIDDNTPTKMNVTPKPYGYDLFRDETSSYVRHIGTHNYKYVSKMAKLKNAAFDLIIGIDVYKPRYADFNIYVKLIKVDELLDVDQIPYINIPIDDLKDFTSTSINDLTTFYLTASDFLTDAQLPQFRAFQIKIVCTAKNPSEPPIFKNLKAIAIT